MIVSLPRMIYGKPVIAGKPAEQADILARSDALPPETAHQWHALTAVQPLPGSDLATSQAVGIFALPSGDHLLVRTHDQGDAQNAVYEYILLPQPTLRDLQGQLAPLLAFCQEPIKPYPVTNAPLSPLELDDSTQWSPQEARALLDTLFQNYAQGDLLAVLSLLGAALHERRLVLRGFPPGWLARARLAQGLMLLLPADARSVLTFSTNMNNDIDSAGNSPRVIFSDTPGTHARWEADWTRDVLPGEAVLQHPYISHLQSLWDGSLNHFYATLREMDAPARLLLPGLALDAGLSAVVERHQLDRHVAEGGAVPLAQLVAVLTGAAPPQGALRSLYASQLLRVVLGDRNAEARALVARLMDAEPPLDAVLAAVLNNALYAQPDNVYAFVRARLLDGEPDERWRERLRLAALAALQVAVADGDTETLLNWLRLIAREPAQFALSDVLHNAILASQPRAAQDGELGQTLLTLAVRRAPTLLDRLLADDALLDALPEGPGQALRSAGEDIAPAARLSLPRELFLLMLAQAVERRAAATLTPPLLERLWLLAAEETQPAMPEAYQPSALVKRLLETSAGWLKPDALEFLMTRLLQARDDARLMQLVTHAAESQPIYPVLVTALQHSQRSATDILDLVGLVSAAGLFNSQQAVDTYVRLLGAWDWRRTALPLVEQLARLLQKNPALTASRETLWHLMDVAAEVKSDAIGRVGARRLFADLEKQEDDTVLLQQLAGLIDHLQWSAALRAQVIGWWRTFTRQQPTARLLRIEKWLDSKTPSPRLEEAHTVVQTVIALRRLLGQRDIKTFAQQLAITYDTLQAFADSFEPSPRQPTSFDQATVREELDAQQEGLEAHERNILANNFRDVAQLIASMGDSRSKGGIVRRGNDLNRQLMSGEHQPQSAVDVMKWLAGYLGGVQDDDGGGDDD